MRAKVSEVGLPTGLGDDVENCGLQKSADVHRFGAAVGENAFFGGAAGNNCRHPKRRRDAFGEGSHIDDMAGVIARGDRMRIGIDAEVMGPIVLDQEGTVRPNDVEDLRRGGL